MDGEVKFEGGKNNRDILGSYYTQEEFAYEITQKAIEEYLENNIREEVNELKMPAQCGGITVPSSITVGEAAEGCGYHWRLRITNRGQDVP